MVCVSKCDDNANSYGYGFYNIAMHWILAS